MVHVFSKIYFFLLFLVLNDELSLIIWIIMGASFFMIVKFLRGYRAFVVATVVRLVYSLGVVETLWIIGSLQVEKGEGPASLLFSFSR